MSYYDGNTVTALWEYAQNFALSDNSFSTTFGPSTPGALNLISGQTHGATPSTLGDAVVGGTVIGDPDPVFDDCASSFAISMAGTNIGDLLNANGVTWGWFQGGFGPTSTTATGKAVCGSTHTNIAGISVKDYSAHHEPFQYYQSTSNPHHVPPSSVAMIGLTDQANHQYDLTDFWAAANSDNLPSVSFLKASKYQDGHPGYSDPVDEQHFLVNTINVLEKLPTWHSTAIIIAYDDSDGWYDHVMPQLVHPSSDPANDAVLGTNLCGQTQPGQFQDRCGYGPQLPLLAISLWAKPDFVDHTVTDQASILRFIEDNWHTGRIGNQSFDAGAGSLLNMFSFTRGPRADRLFLDESTGLPIQPTEDDSSTITSGE